MTVPPATISPLDALKSIEPQFFADYLSFSGLLREYASDTLAIAFRADPNALRRRYHMLTIVGLEYAAYEDAAALLKSFLEFRTGTVQLPIVSLMNYRPGEAVLDTVLSDHGIAKPEQLYPKLAFGRAVPTGWRTWFPDLDLDKALRLACQFIALDCRANQKRHGISAYNKIKHGLLCVPSASRYSATMPDIPATIFPTRQPTAADPFILYGFPVDDRRIDDRERLVHFTQKTLRLFVAVHLGAAYPEKAANVWGGVEQMWRSNHCRDLRDFIAEITTKK